MTIDQDSLKPGAQTHHCQSGTNLAPTTSPAKGGDRICALHANEVEYIKYGSAISSATRLGSPLALDEGFFLGMRSITGNPYDSHTLHEALEQVEILTDRPDLAVTDRGYRGHGPLKTRALISGCGVALHPISSPISAAAAP